MRPALRDKIIAVCEKKIAQKGEQVGVSFYAFFANKNDDPELLMEAALNPVAGEDVRRGLWAREALRCGRGKPREATPTRCQLWSANREGLFFRGEPATGSCVIASL